MCGIYGIINTNNSKRIVGLSYLKHTLRSLHYASLSRGSEATGLTALSYSTASLIKIRNKVRDLFTSYDYRLIESKYQKKNVFAVMGHTRMATHGSANDNKFNQPMISRYGKLIGVHNGIITNFQQLCGNCEQESNSDSQELFNYIEQKLIHNNSTNSLEVILSDLKQNIYGTANIAFFIPSLSKFVLFSNHGSLYYCKINSCIYFASESLTIKKILHVSPKQVKESFVILNIIGINKKYRFLDMSNKSIQILKRKSELNTIEQLSKHIIDESMIAQIKRCSKCILPASTPFITFNQDGVCNYCLTHQQIRYSGKIELEKVMQKYRKRHDRVNCLVAFSGGRDSSYGLHVVKKEFGMNPIAFTYDWGMISELGRRNQARVLSKLGVEQILISANLASKRKHIRQNILAWIRKPDLGMVPIFMQGDKQCEYYADQVMRKYDLPLMIYCRGNELEKEEFKAGYSGIKNADPGGVIHNLSLADKFRLLKYYGKEFLRNPHYLNSSLVDAAFGFVSTYLIKHNYLYLWHYYPWDEKLIINTLTDEYNWELSNDTVATWRIGDGTPAFYNYIYYQVQGFTENDSFRSRQIREGLISREAALRLVLLENKPQYSNLKWYFDTLDLDGDTILTVVDKMSKKYKLIE